MTIDNLAAKVRSGGRWSRADALERTSTPRPALGRLPRVRLRKHPDGRVTYITTARHLHNCTSRAALTSCAF